MTNNMRARLGYRAVVAYLEDVLARMEQLGVKKSDLAVRLNLKRPAVSRLFEPGRNLTMFTAAMIAEALDARLEVKLSPKDAHLQPVAHLVAAPAYQATQQYALQPIAASDAAAVVSMTRPMYRVIQNTAVADRNPKYVVGEGVEVA